MTIMSIDKGIPELGVVRRKLVLLWTAGILGTLLAIAMCFTPMRFFVLGIFGREHFFHGMPSSYWSLAIQRWYDDSTKEQGRTISGVSTVTDYFGVGGNYPPVLVGGAS